MLAITAGLLAGLGGLLAMAVAAVLSPVLGLPRGIAAMASKAKTASGLAGPGIFPDGDAQAETRPEQGRRAEDHRLAV